MVSEEIVVPENGTSPVESEVSSYSSYLKSSRFSY